MNVNWKADKLIIAHPALFIGFHLDYSISRLHKRLHEDYILFFYNFHCLEFWRKR